MLKNSSKECIWINEVPQIQKHGEESRERIKVILEKAFNIAFLKPILLNFIFVLKTMNEDLDNYIVMISPTR